MMPKHLMEEKSKQTTDEDYVYTRRYTVSLKRNGMPSFLA